MWKRILALFKIKSTKMLDRAENPHETLDYSYEQQLQQLQKVKRGIAEVVTAKKRLEAQRDKLQSQVSKLESQARAALSQGNETLARTALERKQLAAVQLTELQAQVDDMAAQQDKLIANEAKMRSSIESFRNRKEVIKAQYSAAEAQVQISEAATGVGEKMAETGLAMQRALDKTEQMRARANAMEELEASGAFDLPALGDGNDDIDRQLAQIGAQTQVDDEMQRLRAELTGGSATEPAQLSKAPAESIDGVVETERAEVGRDL